MSQRSGKVEKDVSASTANRLLVICIDRDNDVGEKGSIEAEMVETLQKIESLKAESLEYVKISDESRPDLPQYMHLYLLLV